MKQTEINYINNESLGFRLVTNELKSKYENSSYEIILANTSSINNNSNEISSYLLAVADFYFSSEESLHSVRLKDKQRTVYIDSLGITAIDFDLSSERKLELVNSGCEAVQSYLQSNRNNKVLKIENSSNRTHALAFLEKGYFSKNLNVAISHYDKSIELNPKLAEAYFNKGQCLKKLKHKNFQQTIDKAIQLNSNIENAFKEGKYNYLGFSQETIVLELILARAKSYLIEIRLIFKT
jgi:hypothetical protein